MVADKAKAGVGRPAGVPAPDKKGSCPFLQRLDALRDRRGRHVQIDCGKVEGSTAVDGGKGGKLGGV
jgi:hypothetical protein